MQEYDVQAGRGRQQIRDNAFQAGAFGGGRQGIEMSNFFRRHVPLPSGAFLWENKYAEGIQSLPYIDASISRSREMFDLSTNNIIITLTFNVLGHWDYHEEERLEVPKIDRMDLLDSIKN